MSWFYRIKNEWKSKGVIERITWLITLGGFVSTILWFLGLITKSNVFILLFAIFFLLDLIIIFLNISMRHERDKQIAEKNKAEQRRIRDNDNAATKLDAVYKQKNNELCELKRALDRSAQLLTDENARANKEKERADKLVIVLKLKDAAINKATNTVKVSLALPTNAEIVERGSPEHLKGLTSKQANDLANKIAREEAGIEL